MIQPADLPQTLAIFPLPGALLLPRAKLPLQIFEPRYLQMLEDCLKTGPRLIGMVQPRCPDDPKALFDVGCAGRVTQMSETDDGRYFITLTGVSRFVIEEELEGFTPYRRCRVRWTDFSADSQRDMPFAGVNRAGLMDILPKFFEAQGLSTDWDAMQDAEDELLVNSLAMMLDFRPEDKQAMLEAATLAERHETLVALIEFMLRSQSDETKLQ